MKGFVPLSLRKWATVSCLSTKVGGRWLWAEEGRADLAQLPAGRQLFWGIPFDIVHTARARQGTGPRGAAGGGPKLLVLSAAGVPGVPKKVTIPLAKRAGDGKVRWVVVAHFCDLSWPPGSPLAGSVRAGEHLATYRLVFADGVVSQSICRRFQINDYRHGWGQLPFHCYGHVPFAPGSAEVPWGARQTDVSAGPYSRAVKYWLFPWENPLPDEPVQAIELEAMGETPVAVAAITLCSSPTNPLRWTPLEAVTVKFSAKSALAARELQATLDRGVVTRVKPLPGMSRTFAKEQVRGWGELGRRLEKVSAARVEAFGSPEATLTVKTAKGEATVSWTKALQARGARSAGGAIEVRPAYRGKAYLHVDVVDAQTGAVTPARVHFRGFGGEYIAPVGHHTDVNPRWFEDVGGDVIIGATTYAYVDGRFQAELPVGPVGVEVVKGFEYEPLRTVVTVKPGQRKLTLRLRRWSDLRREGFYSGDTHIHFISTQTGLLEAQAEGLNVANILAAQLGRLFTNVHDFTGAPSGVSTPETIVYVNTENRQHMLGHLILLGQKHPVFPLSTSGPDEAYLGGTTDVSLADWCDASHAQGGLVIAPHFPNPYLELAADILLGKIDAAEIRPSPAAEPNFVLREWYRYLNLGCRLPCVGGTDKMSNSVPVGIIRTYAEVDRERGFAYDSWCDAIRAGRTFTTTGPLLRLTVDGHAPGDLIRMSRGGGTVEVEAEARCALPLTNLTIVQNGATVAQTASAKGRRSLRLKATVPVPRPGGAPGGRGKSCWIAAHAWGPRPTWPLAAHSSPVYVTVDNENVFLPTEASYALTLIEGGITWARNLATFRREEKQQDIINLFEKARKLLEGRLRAFPAQG
jgi:hypothetical protein